MAQTFNQTIKTEFNKGLLTEFSELNFPDNASIDELNCVLHKAGNRTKRSGLNFEGSFALTSETYAESTLFHTCEWSNVGQDPSVSYVVVQAGSKLRFFQRGGDSLSGSPVKINDTSSTDFIVNLSDYNYPGGLGAAASRVDVASVNGYLIVVSPQIDAIRIEQNETDKSFTITKIDFTIRDFGFYSDPSKRYEEDAPSSSVGVARKYDTANAGWVGKGKEARDDYIVANTAYPPLTHPWYSGKDSNGNFDVAEWEKIYSGTTLITAGHYLIDLFNPDRDAASGLSGVKYYDGREIEKPKSRFSSVAAYAGRAWYGGVDSKVYYSKTIEAPSNIGECHSHNDPTAEWASDTLATDGGYIRLPEASGIRKLHVFGSSLMVFADNGVWRISGIDGNLFQADSFSVYKITDFGLAFRGSFISGQNAVPFWWSYVGIHTIQVNEQGGMVEVNLSRDTIQSFWDNIGPPERAFVTSTYDSIHNTLVWAYPNQGETIEYKLNNFLFLDADLGAFYPWKVSDDPAEPGKYVCALEGSSGKGAKEVVFNVIDENGDQVLDELGNEVIVKRQAGNLRSSQVNLLTRDNTGAITFSAFEDDAFVDWGTAGYEAYAESAYNFIGDLGRRKNSPYITIFMRQTETNFIQNGLVYDLDRPSSMKVSAYWDFKKQATGAPQEAYRFKQPLVVDPDNLAVNSPTTVLTTRLKLRGRGRVVRLRFEGEDGKDFNLLGWETLDAKNSGY